MRAVVGVPGFAMTPDQRFWELVRMVGGTGEAARITGKSTNTIRNWGEPDTRRPLEEMLKLCVEAGVTLDWFATGYMTRPDIAAKQGDSGGNGLGEEGAPAKSAAGDYVGLMPLRPERHEHNGSPPVERWTPSEVGLSAGWLDARRLSRDRVRYAIAGDAGMTPIIGKGDLVVIDIGTRPLSSGLYLTTVGDELLARRLQRLPDGRAELVADAEPSWRFSLPPGAEGGSLLYRIVWAGGDL